MPLRSLTRRRFLRAAGVSLALPLLSSAMPVTRAAGAAALPRRRLVAILFPLSFHGPCFFPDKAGPDYPLSSHLSVLADFRQDFTVFSGLSHPGIPRTHSCTRFFLTGASSIGKYNFRNTISLDQLAAEHVGGATRFATLNLGDDLSWSRTGVQMPGIARPSQAFARLFLTGRAEDTSVQARKLREGQSIMDAVRDQAKDMQRDLPARDRERLDEYFSAVRDVEQRLVKAEEWERKPKPKVNVPPPRDVLPTKDPIGHLRLMYDLIHLALQTDSTRLVTLNAGLMGSQPVVQGMALDYHDLSHHGQNADKIANLVRIELELMKAFRDFLRKLKESNEEGESLLERTMVLAGSNLGNASSHDTTNLPILLAGGGFKHGQHLAFSRENNVPLCKLYVSLLQQLGLTVASFGSGKGTLPGLE